MIRIYPGQMPSRPIEEHPWAGSIAEWFAAAGIDYAAQELQPVTLVVNGVELPVDAWAATVVSNADDVSIRPIPRGGVFKAIGSIISKVFGFLFGAPKTAKRQQTPSGKSLETADASANMAKPNAVVPELIGRFKRYPDYLVQPRRYFADPRTQYLEMLLCVGPGEYDIEQVNIGNTAFASLPGAEYAIHAPGADLSGVLQRLNWYSCPEVGGTSGGTAGLELTSVPSSAVGPQAGSYVLNGATISIPEADPAIFPASWGAGTQMSLMFARDVTVTRTSVSSGESTTYTNRFTANWGDIAPTVGMMLATGGQAGLPASVRVMSVAGDEITLGRYASGEESGSWQLISNITAGGYRIGFERAGRVFTVAAVSDKQVTLDAGFVARTVSAAESAWAVNADTVYGEMAGPFTACPVSEVTSALEVDVFFPQGLCYVNDEGGLQQRSVGIEISWRAVSGGVWQSASRWYSAATMDQIGYTERIDGLAPERYQVRVRRRGAASTSTQVNDKLQWLGLRSLLPTPSSYAGWTTMSVRIRGLGQIAASSENQVNLVATRKLPALQSDGTWSAPVATRSISAALGHIARTTGYADASLDLPELQRLHGVWTGRGEFVDHVFDETTAKAAIDLVLSAGMSEQTVDEGLIRPVRDDVRTVPEQLFSMQNTTGKGITKSFSAPAPDDNDGLEVEFADAADGWSKKTVVAALPDSPQIKLKKLKLDGVTDRTRAWRIGMREARRMRFQRWQYSLGAELEGLIVGYGSLIGLADESPGFAQSMQLTEITGDSTLAVLSVSEPLLWEETAQHVVHIRRPDGSVAGPYTATPGADELTLHAVGISLADWPVISMRQELPHVVFGPLLPAVVTKVSPDSTGAKITAINYDARIFADDNNYPQPA